MLLVAPTRGLTVAVLALVATTASLAATTNPPEPVVESVGPDGIVLSWESLERGTGSPRPRLLVWLGDVDPGSSCAVEEQPPMLGTTAFERRVSEVRAVFRPRLPLRSGRVYTVCLDLLGDEAGGESPRRWAQTVSFEDSAVSVGEPRIVSVWPSPDEPIPANTLRFYVEFDRPMRAAAVDRAVQLVDDQGDAVADALVPVPEGLWDAERRRLTVTLHPGRIKQGVGPREAQGAALEAGAVARLRVGRELRSAGGVPVAPEVFEFDVVAADRIAPDPSRWRLLPPSSAEDALLIEFDERLDPRVLQRSVRLMRLGEQASSGQSLDRAVDLAADLEVVDHGRAVRVGPSSGPWHPGSYLVEVFGIVEDLAGNRPGRLFDAELDADGPVGGAGREPEWLRFDFEIRAWEGNPVNAPGRLNR